MTVRWAATAAGLPCASERFPPPPFQKLSACVAERDGRTPELCRARLDPYTKACLPIEVVEGELERVSAANDRSGSAVCRFKRPQSDDVM